MAKKIFLFLSVTTLTFHLQPLKTKSDLFILKSKWMSVPNFNKFSQGVPGISCSPVWCYFAIPWGLETTAVGNLWMDKQFWVNCLLDQQTPGHLTKDQSSTGESYSTEGFTVKVSVYCPAIHMLPNFKYQITYLPAQTPSFRRMNIHIMSPQHNSRWVNVIMFCWDFHKCCFNSKLSKSKLWKCLCDDWSSFMMQFCCV